MPNIRKYPQVFIPNEYLDQLVRSPPEREYLLKHFSHAVILCDYCIEQYTLAMNLPIARTGGWLTDERCPLHKHFWLKFWMLHIV